MRFACRIKIVLELDLPWITIVWIQFANKRNVILCTLAFQSCSRQVKNEDQSSGNKTDVQIFSIHWKRNQFYFRLNLSIIFFFRKTGFTTFIFHSRIDSGLRTNLLFEVVWNCGYVIFSSCYMWNNFKLLRLLK